MEELRDDVRSFVEMIREESPRWTELEWRFGMDAETRIQAGEESVLVRGVVDRVDDHGTHLRVVDYKTGGGYGYSSRSGVYNGGRRLQHFVYTAAVAALHDRPVDAMEYHFPTRRGENRIRGYDASQLRHGGHLVASLLEWMSQGWFPATDNPRDDCRYCDYKEVCGAETSDWGHTSCGVAEWTARNLETAGELSLLRRVRNWENEEPVF
ncbi:MAG: PD-(D/E)XK nuclease family protein [Gemmatimonadetes bacterium]|nr:PD-(D/E)XK nuclease family protein [Gemmatimonadota bacterium]